MIVNNSSPVLAKALSAMLDKIDAELHKGGYHGPPIRMFLVGGMAVNFYCGNRATEDVDASFSRRLLLPHTDMVVDYQNPDGTPGFIYLDQNYNPFFSLRHEDAEDCSVEWQDIGNEGRLVHLYVLSPLDLAVTKISRGSEQDRQDILSLAREGLFTVDELRARVKEAIRDYVGCLQRMGGEIEGVCQWVQDELSLSGPRL